MRVQRPDGRTFQTQQTLPALGAVAADPHAFLAAEVEGGGMSGIGEEGADVALDEHAALAGAAEGLAVVAAAEDAFADGADKEQVRFHGASAVFGFCLQGRSSRRAQSGGSSASSGSMQGMPSR